MNKASIKKEAREVVEEAFKNRGPGPIHAIGRATDLALGDVLGSNGLLTEKVCRGFASIGRKILEREGFRFFSRGIPNFEGMLQEVSRGRNLEEMRHTAAFPLAVELALAKDAPRSYKDYLDRAGWEVRWMVWGYLLGDKPNPGVAHRVLEHLCECVDIDQSRSDSNPISLINSFLRDEEVEKLANLYIQKAVDISITSVDAGVAKVHELDWVTSHFNSAKKKRRRAR